MNDTRNVGVLLAAARLGGQLGLLVNYCEHQAGLRVEAVADGNEALRRARADRPLLVVTDLVLPGLDGLSLCRALREGAATRSSRVLMVSILAAERRAYEAGADAFFQRPCEDGALIASAVRLLGIEEPGVDLSLRA